MTSCVHFINFRWAWGGTVRLTSLGDAKAGSSVVSSRRIIASKVVLSPQPDQSVRRPLEGLFFIPFLNFGKRDSCL
jgi:hypothetical protein